MRSDIRHWNEKFLIRQKYFEAAVFLGDRATLIPSDPWYLVSTLTLAHDACSGLQSKSLVLVGVGLLYSKSQ